MNEIIDYLKKSGVQYFATIGLDGKPKVRPFQFMFAADGKLWFCTSSQKEVYKEMQKHSYIELCASGDKMSWMRLQGKAVFADDSAIKEKVFAVSPLVKEIYKEINNPFFKVFYLGEATAAISRTSKPTRVINV